MFTRSQGRAALDRLAERVNRARRGADDLESGQAWGQFLDVAPGSTQTGPYGTCGALIVLGCAGHVSRDGAQRGVVETLRYWWNRWVKADDEGRRDDRFSENLRAALLLLALRVSRVDPKLAEAVEESLWDRRLPHNGRVAEGVLGDWWISEAEYDSTPRIVPTALALLALAAGRSPGESRERELYGLASGLEEKLVGSPDPPRLHSLLSAAALLSVPGRRLRHETRAQLRALGLGSSGSVGDLGVYFYENRRGESASDRDYFIVPTELLLVIAGASHLAPWYLQLRAEAVGVDLYANLLENKGVYRPDPEQKLATKNQGWAALALRSLIDRRDERGTLLRLLYWIARRKRERRSWDRFIGGLAGLAAIWCYAAYTQSNPSPWAAGLAAVVYTLISWVFFYFWRAE